MKPAGKQNSARAAARRKITGLQLRLAEAEEALRAIRNGEVDAVVVAGADGDQIFTLDGAGLAYRVLIESINEGALTLTAGATILYANQCFAKMAGCPLEQVMGSSFRRFLSAEAGPSFQQALDHTAESGAKIQVMLHARDGKQMAAQISLRALGPGTSSKAAFGMVVTDLTESRRSEERLRALTHRVVQAQEAERSRVASELHDRITQPLCAVVVQSQVLVAALSPPHASALRKAAKALRDQLGRTADEVERISRDLRPSVLIDLGLEAVVIDTCAAFAKRTGISVNVSCPSLEAPMSPDVDLTLYRILQEALENAGTHARARHVKVRLTQQAGFAELSISDDGIGFDPDRPSARGKAGGLGLLGMRERANYVGGAFTLRSGRRAGTSINVKVPL